MIFKITFKVLDQGASLPLSYQYELSSWIYRLMADVDRPFATWLHDQGYDLHGKRFKLFTFSRLNVPKGGYNIKGDRMQINASFISFKASFLVEKAAETLIMGIFQEQKLFLGDKKSQISLQVDRVELLPIPLFGEQAYFRTSSPIVISQKTPDHNKETYLHPLATNFEELFWHNLRSKYTHAVNYRLTEALDWENDTFDLKILSAKEQIKSRLITIKAFTPQQTRVRGYLFDFALTAPKPLLRFGAVVGFGAFCSQGFGCVRVLE
ncbi:CRISPR-associated endoribonuclease Cas6 [marine bacterium AO1-C]|nr:CRISPR-associated endoribonuclease Cas6 [marine bacterium AO1-C]